MGKNGGWRNRVEKKKKENQAFFGVDLGGKYKPVCLEGEKRNDERAAGVEKGSREDAKGGRGRPGGRPDGEQFLPATAVGGPRLVDLRKKKVADTRLSRPVCKVKGKKKRPT